MKQIQIITLWCLVIGIFFTEQINAQALHWLSKPGSDLGPILNHDVNELKVSANGRYISFSSKASNIVAGDTNQKEDVFVHDTLKNKTIRVAEQFTNHLDGSHIEQFSAPTSDGEWIGFIGDGDFGFATTSRSLYLQNLITGVIQLVSVDAGGTAYRVDSEPIFLADDASSIVFETYAKLSPLHTDNVHNLYSKNLIDDSHTLLSVSAQNNSGADERIGYYAVSANFRYLAMSSKATNLVNNSDALFNVFLRDIQKETTQLVTVKPNGDPSSYSGYDRLDQLAVSNAGQVAFVSKHNDLVSGDNNSRADLFFFNGENNTRINVDENNQEFSWSSVKKPVFNANGTQLVFTDGNALLRADSNSAPDIYSYQIDQSKLSLITDISTPPESDTYDPIVYAGGFLADDQSLILLSNLNQNNSSHYNFQAMIYKYEFNNARISEINPIIFNPNTTTGDTYFPAISNDQRWVVYTSTTRNLTNPAKPDSTNDLFLLDRATNRHQIIGRQIVESHVSPTDRDIEVPDISASGRYVTFVSSVSQPAGIADFGEARVFLYDSFNSQYTNIAKGSQPKVNNAGKVVFSTSKSLTVDDTNFKQDVYMFNPDDDSYSLISANPQGMSGNGVSTHPAINDLDDQVWIVFRSSASDLMVADDNNRSDIFMRQWPTGQIFRVSQTSTSVGGNSHSYTPSITQDGRYVAFLSSARNFTSDDYSDAGDKQGFVYDRIDQNIELVTKDDNNLPIGKTDPIDQNDGVYSAVISSAGGFVAYETDYEVLPEDNDDREDLEYHIDIYLYDYNNGINKLISKTIQNQQVGDFFHSPQVVEDTTVSPIRVGVVFSGRGGLTDVAEHPGYLEAFLYQQGGPSELIFEDSFE